MYIGTALYIMQLRYVYRHRTLYSATAICIAATHQCHMCSLRDRPSHKEKAWLREAVSYGVSCILQLLKCGADILIAVALPTYISQLQYIKCSADIHIALAI